jgi:Putative cyclase
MNGLLQRFRHMSSLLMFMLMVGCSTRGAIDDQRLRFAPSEVIDLGALVTEDLPERMWGKAFLKQMNFTHGNSFNVIRWTFPMEGGSVSGSNAYYTLFNHGGPHVDAPNHMGFGDGLDSYRVDTFAGPVKVFDVSGNRPGRSVPADVFKGHVEKGDIVLMLTRYTPPQTDDALPQLISLTHEAAELLAALPVHAYGTDAFSVDALDDRTLPSIHQSFSRVAFPSTNSYSTSTAFSVKATCTSSVCRSISKMVMG